METLHFVVFVLAGLAIGSFLNVVIWRLPRGESVVRPRSRCPGCGHVLAWYENVPVLSWLLLRGRCRACHAPISVRYPLVEVLTGILFALAWRAWPGEPLTAGVVAVALAALLAASAIDWEHKILPDAITKPGIALGILLAPLTRLHPPDWIEGLKPALSAWLHAGAGAVAGALLILGIRWLGALVFRKEAMGLGDVKLLAMIGTLVGPVGVLYALVLASFSGAVIGVLRLLWAQGRPLRFSGEVKGLGPRRTFDRARIVGEDLLAVLEPAPTEGGAVTVHLVLPAAGILEDEDARVTVSGRLEAPAGPGQPARIHVVEASDADRERLDLLAASLRYVPFGPFLALGGALVLLLGDRVSWWVTEAWPRFVQRLL